MGRTHLRPAALLFAFAALFMLFTVNVSVFAKSGGSEVLVRRVDTDTAMKIRIFIDGKSAAQLKVGTTVRIKIKNGVHTIYATATGYFPRSTEVSQFTAYDSRHIFSVTDTSLVFIGQENIGISSAGSPNFMGGPGQGLSSLDRAVQSVFQAVVQNLKSKSKVAIINIAADNRAEGTFVIEQFTDLCVNSKKPKLTVIDRRKIESIRIAKNFDRTSDMEDDFVTSIGSLLGADYVITGSLNGSGPLRRFRVKILNVRTGVITAMATAAV